MRINFSQTVNEILTFLQDFKVYVVGGYVRDYLRGVESVDVDLAIDADIKDWLPVLKTRDFKISVYENYQSVHFKYERYHFHISRMRTDIACDGRQAQTLFTSDMKLDAQRRDFTLNSLYGSKNGEIIDFFGGIGDIQNKKIVFIGDPEKRIREDYLRIFRYFRFLAMLNSQVDHNVLDIIQKNVLGIKKLSKERILEEWLKILNEPFAVHVFSEMNKAGLHQAIFEKDLVWFASITEIVLENGISQLLPFPRKYLKRAKCRDNFNSRP